MRMVVFGAAGKTGRLVVGRALAAGHEVRAFVRDASKLGGEGERLEVMLGDVMDAGRVDEAVADADAVVSALGHTKTSAKDVQTVGTRNIVGAMGRHGVRRLVSLTGAGVRDPKDEPGLFDRAIVTLLGLVQRDVLEDARGHAEVIASSGLEWTVVRAPMLTDGKETGSYNTGYVGRESGTKISRADVADFMVRQITDETYLGKSPMVSYK